MKRFKVNVIELALKNNKVAKSGDVVTEGQLTGNSVDLLKGKFITEVDSKDAKKAEKEAAELAAFEKAHEEGNLNAAQLDSITMDKIGEYADAHGYVYDSNDLKPDLIKQVLKAEKAKK